MRVENHESYDTDRYPLGFFKKERYEADAKFAYTQIEELQKLDLDKLTESERISALLQLFCASGAS